MRILIGIDDTDNLESRGTGYRARHLGASLAGFAVVEGITRHQLLVDPRIPYTSHNSSTCLVVRTSVSLDDLAGYCRTYLVRESAAGSDAGLCLAPWPAVGPSVLEFGHLAKTQVLTHEAAEEIARRSGLLLEGLTGDGGGVIGALAAVGLRTGGNDGRYIWLEGLRELKGIYTVERLREAAAIDAIESLDGAGLPATAMVDAGPWPRPILRGGRAVLLVEEAKSDGGCQWRVALKEAIKRYSD